MERHITEEEDWEHIISQHGKLLLDMQETLKNQDRVLAEIQTTLKPISNIYTTSTTLGRWFSKLIVIASIVIGIIISLKVIFK